MSERSEQSSLAGMTVEIVSAYVAHNRIAAAELGDLIGAVAGQLGKLGTESEPPAESRPAPAVPVRRSIQPDHLVCLVCGNKQKLLKRHLAVEHHLTPDQYRRTFELRPEYPMAAPHYTEQRRQLALKIGLGQPKKARKRRRSTAQPSTAEAS